jgi:putative oxidoreductase
VMLSAGRRPDPGAVPPGTPLAENTDMLRSLVRWTFVPPVTAPRATLLIRIMAGAVFLSEGVLKFVYANQGVGRFTKLGMPVPAFTSAFVGVLEIAGGLLLILGLLTRALAIAFIIEMVVAILSTKISLYLGTSPLPAPPAPPRAGFWAVMHETRSDFAQLLNCAFLLIVGPGPWSLDALLQKRRTHGVSSTTKDTEPSHKIGIGRQVPVR